MKKLGLVAIVLGIKMEFYKCMFGYSLKTKWFTIRIWIKK